MSTGATVVKGLLGLYRMLRKMLRAVRYPRLRFILPRVMTFAHNMMLMGHAPWIAWRSASVPFDWARACWGSAASQKLGTVTTRAQNLVLTAIRRAAECTSHASTLNYTSEIIILFTLCC